MPASLRNKRLAWVAGFLALAGVVWLVYGTGYVDYDLLYGLLWGHQIDHGVTPDFHAVHAPTPHPLVNALSILISPLGSGALVFWHVAGVLALAFLGVAAFRLGRELVSWRVGVVFAAILLTRQLIVERAMLDSIDIPFLALVLLAGSLELERPKRGPAVLVPLLIAGLLRPEAWLLAAAYAIYVWRGADRRTRITVAALAAAGPVLWLGFDLVVSGDALLSLHHTSSAAARIGRPRGVGTAITHAPRYLKGDLHVAALAGGIVGAVVATLALGRRTIVPWALLVFGGVAFFVYGVSGQPLLARYLFLPAAVLALFCAVLLAGWNEISVAPRLRSVWLVAAVVALAGLVVTAPSERRKLATTTATAHRTARADRDLEHLSHAAPARPFIRSCAPLQVADFRGAPLLAYLLGRAPTGVTTQNTSAATSGVLIAPPPHAGRDAPPGGFASRYRDRSWILYERCARVRGGAGAG